MDERTRQLFILGPEIWASISKEEVMETARSMMKAGVYHNYPFEEFDIHAHARAADILNWLFNPPEVDEPGYYEYNASTQRISFKFRYYGITDRGFQYSMAIPAAGRDIYLPSDSEELLDLFGKMGRADASYMNDTAAGYLLITLLVLLATKNVEKEVIHNPKRLKDPTSKNGVRQIRNRDYQYVTTIKVGKITETMGDGEGRGPVRPHLRRGHLRNQRFGEGLKETRQIFIPPVFVNADDKWIDNQRKGYRVKL